MPEYFCVLTNAGAALEARALAEGKGIVLTHFAIGDANGLAVVPSPTATALVHEVHRQAISARSQDENDPRIMLLHATIPADVGGWWINELGVVGHLEGEDNPEDEVLYAYANHARYYKMLPQEGQSITHEITVPVIQSTAAEVTIDVVDGGYATRRQVAALEDELAAEVAALRAELAALRAGDLPVSDDLILTWNAAFDSTIIPTGFVPKTGTVITDAATRYPKAWAKLQQSDYADLLTTEELWQQASRAVYYTDAAGNQYSWDGVGGVTKYVLDLDNGTLRMPDVRGLHMEAAGYNSLAVGQVARDEIREINGVIHFRRPAGNLGVVDRTYTRWAFEPDVVTTAPSPATQTADGQSATAASFLASRVAPTGPRTSPARYGVLPCVYLGS